MTTSTNKLLSTNAGGRWKCVHIDDPKCSDICLPSLHECLASKASKILGVLLAEGNDEPPPLEDDMEVCYIISSCLLYLTLLVYIYRLNRDSS